MLERLVSDKNEIEEMYKKKLLAVNGIEKAEIVMTKISWENHFGIDTDKLRKKRVYAKEE